MTAAPPAKKTIHVPTPVQKTTAAPPAKKMIHVPAPVQKMQTASALTKKVTTLTPKQNMTAARIQVPPYAAPTTVVLIEATNVKKLTRKGKGKDMVRQQQQIQ